MPPLVRQCPVLPIVPRTDLNSGIIKSPVSTTALQVVTRVIQVWMVWYSFPQSTAASHAYLALLLAWSVADTIRYLYLAFNMHGKASKGLVWLRYVTIGPGSGSAHYLTTKVTPCSIPSTRLVLEQSGGCCIGPSLPDPRSAL